MHPRCSASLVHAHTTPAADHPPHRAPRRPAACPPHLYAAAEQAYRNLCHTASSQAIVVSGVSGAGKTEANKHIMQYLCWRAGQKPASPGKAKVSAELLDVQLSEISRCVLQSSVVFEAFCNACTTNNHNSSRFGKFVRLLVEPDGPIAGAVIDAYLLEKSRLVAQQSGERCFHVFYQLLADKKLCGELGLLAPPPADAPENGERPPPPALAASPLPRNYSLSSPPRPGPGTPPSHDSRARPSSPQVVRTRAPPRPMALTTARRPVSSPPRMPRTRMGSADDAALAARERWRRDAAHQ